MSSSWQRYTDSIAIERMKSGLCPECGTPPHDHGGWGGPRCSLTDTGAAGRIYQFEQDQITEPVAVVWPSDAFPPCIHSGFERDCASCWVGHAQRLEDYAKRLRALITDQLALAEHDRYWLGGNAPDDSPMWWGYSGLRYDTNGRAVIYEHGRIVGYKDQGATP